MTARYWQKAKQRVLGYGLAMLSLNQELFPEPNLTYNPYEQSPARTSFDLLGS